MFNFVLVTPATSLPSCIGPFLSLKQYMTCLFLFLWPREKCFIDNPQSLINKRTLLKSAGWRWYNSSGAAVSLSLETDAWLMIYKILQRVLIYTFWNGVFSFFRFSSSLSLSLLSAILWRTIFVPCLSFISFSSIAHFSSLKIFFLTHQGDTKKPSRISSNMNRL